MKRKIAIAAISAPIIIAALIIGTVLTLLNWPTLIINPTSLKVAARHLAPLGISVEWKNVSTSSVSHGFLDETLNLNFEDFCLSYRETVEKSCFDTIHLSTRYKFKSILPEIVEAGPISLEGGNVNIKVTAAEKKEKAEKKSGKIEIPKIELPKILRHTYFKPINITLNTFSISIGENKYTGNIKIDTKTPEGLLQDVNAKGHIRESNKGLSADFSLAVKSNSGFKKKDLGVIADTKLNLKDSGNVTANIDVKTKPEGSLSHDIKLKYNKDKIEGTVRITGLVEEEKFETKLTGSLSNISEAVTSIELPNCNLQLLSTEVLRNRGKLTFSCPVDLKLKSFDLPKDLDPIYKPPEKIRINVSSKANTFFMPDPDQKTDGTMQIQLQPTKGRLVKTKGDLKIAFAGIPSQEFKTWNVQSDIDIDFDIEEFSKLVKVMQTTNYPVPAPLNVLEGLVEFSLEGHISSVSQLGTFPAKLKTKLKSKEQVIDIDSEGELKLGRIEDSEKKAALELNIALNDVQLQLPNIALAGIPRFTPDGRIILSPEKREKKRTDEIPFNYHIIVKTPENKPVRILSNLTPKYVPINIDLDIKNEAITGTVKISEFPVGLFSRKAILDKLDLDLQEPMEASLVDGSISMEFPELKIIVAMRGPVSNPSITLESKPPMTQGDIVSTLLYGEPLDAIDSDQASSVNDMNAAMANRAMALTSFFLLGSTPIQSIAYNPQTGVFSAKVKLAKKTSLVVGASGSEKQVGIRQRLGKGFSISASAEKDEDQSETAGTAYIEWSKRF